MIKKMNRQEIIERTISFVKEELSNAEGGHDWWHIYRVHNLSKNIAGNEDADMFIVELGALLHDIADYKFNGGDEEIGPKKARDFLESLEVEESIIIHVENIIRNISFSNRLGKQEFRSKELDVVQDADKLDAIGAIGIARAFVFAGGKGIKIYDPDLKPKDSLSKEEYRNFNRDTHTQINHFYEKLLLLKDLMNTNAGKIMAEKRHEFMESYLEEFYAEWEGKK